MPEMSYWKALVSNALRKFQLDRNIEAVQLIRDSNLRVEYNSHDIVDYIEDVEEYFE